MVIVNCAGVVCYFVGVKVTVIVMGGVMVVYVVYSIAIFICTKKQQAINAIATNTTTTDSNNNLVLASQFVNKQTDPNTLLTYS